MTKFRLGIVVGTLVIGIGGNILYSYGIVHQNSLTRGLVLLVSITTLAAFLYLARWLLPEMRRQKAARAQQRRDEP